jgi:hypothetical protein
MTAVSAEYGFDAIVAVDTAIVNSAINFFILSPV